MEVIPERRDIWWVALDPTPGSRIRKTRPCVVISVRVRRRIRAVAGERLRNRLGVVTTEEMAALEDGLKQIMRLG